MKTQEEFNESYKATRNLVIARQKETGIYTDGFYTQIFEMSKSGLAYKMQEGDRFIYVACSACITDGNGTIFVPFRAVRSALRFADMNNIYEYIGG